MIFVVWASGLVAAGISMGLESCIWIKHAIIYKVAQLAASVGALVVLLTNRSTKLLFMQKHEQKHFAHILNKKNRFSFFSAATSRKRM